MNNNLTPGNNKPTKIKKYKYFTKTELAKQFRYSSLSSFISSSAHHHMTQGIDFIVSKIEDHYEPKLREYKEELDYLRAKLDKLNDLIKQN